MGLFRICTLVGFAGWLLIGLSMQVWLVFIISFVLLGFAGVAGSLLFSAIHDQGAFDRESRNDSVVAIARMALTAGWIVGPILGAYLGATVGYRIPLFVAAACCLAQLIPLGTLRDPGRTKTGPRDSLRVVSARPSVRVMLPLLAFCVLYVCAYAGEPVRYAYLPLYMSEQLHLPGALPGAVIGIQPLVELALMPLVVILARRTGPWIPMIAGALFGVAANLCFALTGTVVGLFAGQILMGGVWGVFAALGIIVAQSLLPTAIATATAVFLTAPALSSALGGSVGGIFAQAVGLPAVFFVPATFGLIAVAGFAVMAARLPHLGTRRAPSGQPEDIRLTTTQPD